MTSPPPPPPQPFVLYAELAGRRAHVQLADVARVAAPAGLGVKAGLSIVRVDAESNAEVAWMELKEIP